MKEKLNTKYPAENSTSLSSPRFLEAQFQEVWEKSDLPGSRRQNRWEKWMKGPEAGSFYRAPWLPRGHLMFQFIIRSQPQIAGHIIPQSAEIVFAYCWGTSNPHTHSAPDLYCLWALRGGLIFMIPLLSLALGEEMKLTWFIYKSFVIGMIGGHSWFWAGKVWLAGDVEPMEFLLGSQMWTGDK